METVVLRAQIIAEIKTFTALLQKGVTWVELQESRNRIKKLMSQLEAIDEDLQPPKTAMEN